MAIGLNTTDAGGAYVCCPCDVIPDSLVALGSSSRAPNSGACPCKRWLERVTVSENARGHGLVIWLAWQGRQEPLNVGRVNARRTPPKMSRMRRRTLMVEG